MATQMDLGGITMASHLTTSVTFTCGIQGLGWLTRCKDGMGPNRQVSWTLTAAPFFQSQPCICTGL